MKNIQILLVAILIMTVPAAFAADNDEKIKMLEKRIEQLEKLLMEQKETTDTKMVEQEKKISGVEELIEENEERLSDVEIRAWTDRLSLGAEMLTRVTNTSFSSGWDSEPYAYNRYFGTPYDTHGKPYLTAEEAGVKEESSNFWTSRARITFSGEAHERLRFRGSMTAFYNWADQDDDNSIRQPQQGRYPSSSSEMLLDKAYIEWDMAKGAVPATLLLGRQPSFDGPPYELKADSPRKSVYPQLFFDVVVDAAIVNFNLSNVTKIPGTGLRFTYAKTLQNDVNAYYGRYMKDEEGMDGEVYGLFFETGLPFKIASNQLFVLGYYSINDFYGPNSQGLTTGDTVLGDMAFTGAHLQFDNIMRSGVDLFASYGQMKFTPEDDKAFFGTETDEQTGRAFYAGVRYTLPSFKTKIGLEYNQGSEYWYRPVASDNPVEKLGTRGQAWELYFLQPMLQNKLFLRGGIIQVAYDHTGSNTWYYPVMDTDYGINSMYLELEARF
ncbi:DUF3373 family protein [Limisalsivibrio acetivorans]|uniref:DUF3373 family protein n=1 Tax=Limisalsivibrio acetivorans TaxID=1304888 RepID=UPI0003B62BE2|nr:DUF3373 family protein [Limisalsivibrio acetivorans]